MLERVLKEVNEAIPVSEARRLLEEKNRAAAPIELANPYLRPVAFAFRRPTPESKKSSVKEGLLSRVMLMLNLFLVFVITGLTRAGPHTNNILKSAFLQRRRDKRLVKALARDPQEELSSDGRPPVLFLRSFSSQYTESFDEKDLRTAEERLTDHYKAEGPMLAVGHPKEEIPMLGALKLYFDDETWRAAIIYLMSISQVVVIQVGVTHGTLWELGVAKKMLQPERVDISLASPVQPDVPDQGYYLMFKKYLEEIVGWELPADSGSAVFIRFGPDWEPKFYELSGKEFPFVSRKKK